VTEQQVHLAFELDLLEIGSCVEVKFGSFCSRTSSKRWHQGGQCCTSLSQINCTSNMCASVKPFGMHSLKGSKSSMSTNLSLRRPHAQACPYENKFYYLLYFYTFITYVSVVHLFKKQQWHKVTILLAQHFPSRRIPQCPSPRRSGRIL